MIRLPLYDRTGNKLPEEIEVDEELFGARVRQKVLRDVILMYEANKRVGTASVKRRGEVRGGGRKPWRQKHTGRARAGSIRSPIWKGGGCVFGPKPRDFSYKVPKKQMRIALDSALLSKFRDKETSVIESMDFEKPRTKAMAILLDKIGVRESCLIGVRDNAPNVHLSARNLKRVRVTPVAELNAYDLLYHRNLLLTRDALDRLIELRKK